jgi:hypothetical protein
MSYIVSFQILTHLPFFHLILYLSSAVEMSFK